MTDAMDEALQYLATAVFNARHSLIGNSQLSYFEEEEVERSLEVTNCIVEEGALLLICRICGNTLQTGCK